MNVDTCGTRKAGKSGHISVWHSRKLKVVGMKHDHGNFHDLQHGHFIHLG